MTGGQSGVGTAGDHFTGSSCNYPAVVFSASHCNGAAQCHSYDGKIHNYNNAEEVRNCKLEDLRDLKLGTPYVRDKIAAYMNHLIDLGVAGFRVDAAKHMWPGDLAIIFGKLKNLRSDIFGAGVKPFIFQEVIDSGGEAVHMYEYYGTGRGTNFPYGQSLADIFLNHKNQAKWLRNFGEAWGMPKSDDCVVFLNNHDNQRGHGGGGSLITFRQHKQMKMATAFMLAWPYGFPRVMSSYRWTQSFGSDGKDRNNWMGPPHYSDMSIQTVQINTDMSCRGDWVCEHRWRQIYNMVAFRNVVYGTSVERWWSSGDWQIAFARGNKGFIVINANYGYLSATIDTGLPAGTYCDVISGSYVSSGSSGHCNGTQIHVGAGGRAHFSISGSSEDPVVAIHIGAKIGSPKKVTT